MQHILPVNDRQKLVKVEITAPDGGEKEVKNGISAEDEVLDGIRDAQSKLATENNGSWLTYGIWGGTAFRADEEPEV